MHRKITNNLHTMQPPFDKQHDFIGFPPQLTSVNNVAAMTRGDQPCRSLRQLLLNNRRKNKLLENNLETRLKHIHMARRKQGVKMTVAHMSVAVA